MNFHTTQWSLIEAARDPAQARPALEALCRTYRPPVLAFIRRSGHAEGDAEDLTQEFFARFLERGWYADADPGLGRFRALLLTTLRRFLIDQHARAVAGKRGGGKLCSVDLELIADEHETPEQAFTRSWMQTLLARALDRLRQEWEQAGKRERFELLAPLLLEPRDGEALRQLAARTGERSNTLAVQCHRLRQRLRQLVRLELVQTVGSSEALEQELAELRGLLASDG